jgi:hypothetical protein
MVVFTRKSKRPQAQTQEKREKRMRVFIKKKIYTREHEYGENIILHICAIAETPHRGNILCMDIRCSIGIAS